jgi:hypothetical protein
MVVTVAIFFLVFFGIVTSLARIGTYRGHVWCCHLIFIDLRGGSVEGNALHIAVEEFALRKLAFIKGVLERIIRLGIVAARKAGCG